MEQKTFVTWAEIAHLCKLIGFHELSEALNKAYKCGKTTLSHGVLVVECSPHAELHCMLIKTAIGDQPFATCSELNPNTVMTFKLYTCAYSMSLRETNTYKNTDSIELNMQVKHTHAHP